MTTTVLRYRCDLCGKVHMIEYLAKWCEAQCETEATLAIEARSGTTGTGVTEGESAGPQGQRPETRS